MIEIVLGSSSPARKYLLKRLDLPFKVAIPNIDETPLANESPQKLVKRLAIAKARIHQDQFSNALIIGCDQVAEIGGNIIGKPVTHENAVKMLLQASGQEVIFFTGLCLLNTKTRRFQYKMERYKVTYKKLSLEIIENYLQKEKPYQCAGSIKVEGLGIALMKKLQGSDPTALTGLPLIPLVNMLEKEGVRVV